MATTQLFINQSWTKAFSNEKNGKFAERVQEIAVRELKEDERTKQQCLSQLREWIKQNNDIQNCFTDDSFLLRFLRVKKYSLHLTQQMILKYLNLRKCFGHIFAKLDCNELKANELISSGYIFASPFKDKHGRRIVITTPKRFDTSFYNSTDMARAHVIAYETLIDDEDNQIVGVTHIGDVADVSPSMITMWSINEFATLVTWGEQSFPMRHKEIHVVNMPAMYKYVYDFAISRVSQKLRDRVKMYDSAKHLHDVLDPMLLPLEYGGVMPMSEMVELWRKELVAKRSRLLSYDSMKLLSDEGIIRRRTKINQDSLSGSFRKLDFD